MCNEAPHCVAKAGAGLIGAIASSHPCFSSLAVVSVGVAMKKVSTALTLLSCVSVGSIFAQGCSKGSDTEYILVGQDAATGDDALAAIPTSDSSIGGGSADG